MQVEEKASPEFEVVSMMVMSNCQSSWHNIQQAFQLLLPKVIWIFHKIISSAICINPEKKS